MKRSKFNAFRIFGGGYHAYTERRQAQVDLSPMTLGKGVRGDSTVKCVADFIGGDSYGK